MALWVQCIGFIGTQIAGTPELSLYGSSASLGNIAFQGQISARASSSVYINSTQFGQSVHVDTVGLSGYSSLFLNGEFSASTVYCNRGSVEGWLHNITVPPECTSN